MGLSAKARDGFSPTSYARGAFTGRVALCLICALLFALLLNAPASSLAAGRTIVAPPDIAASEVWLAQFDEMVDLPLERAADDLVQGALADLHPGHEHPKASPQLSGKIVNALPALALSESVVAPRIEGSESSVRTFFAAETIRKTDALPPQLLQRPPPKPV